MAGSGELILLPVTTSVRAVPTASLQKNRFALDEPARPRLYRLPPRYQEQSDAFSYGPTAHARQEGFLGSRINLYV